MVLKVSGCYCQHQTRETTNRKQDYEGYREQHRRLKSHSALPHRRHPVENFHSCWHCNQHRRIHEVKLTREWHSNCEHVVRPHDER